MCRKLTFNAEQRLLSRIYLVESTRITLLLNTLAVGGTFQSTSILRIRAVIVMCARYTECSRVKRSNDHRVFYEEK